LRAVDLEFDRAQTGSAHGDVSSVSLVAQWYDENASMVCAANPETRESYPVACIMWCVSKVVATNLPWDRVRFERKMGFAINLKRMVAQGLP
jgi:hypothetical protein